MLGVAAPALVVAVAAAVVAGAAVVAADVAGDAKYADVLKDLRSRLKEWQVKTKDPWVLKYQHE